ncbi:class I SAM-dependent methyltransferase [Halobacteriales archaeon SW_7_68_16]|nr:MAG: class I SAM-dependent methyltransferase [Halobacteriales archaeon SW_7_68_16]
MDDAGDFFDAFARVYDARYDGDGDDVDFYRDLATAVPGPALEIGVGTGRIYLDLLAADIDADGIDVSPGMLARLRASADERGLDPTVWLADATRPGTRREYGLIYAPARAINHLTTLDDQRAALRAAHDALADGGRFALNTFVPRAEVIVNYDDPDVESVTVDGTEYRIESRQELVDGVEKLVRIEQRLYRGDRVVAERATPIALIEKRTLDLLLDDAGFTDWTVYGGFDRSKPAAERELVVVAKP